MQPVVRHVDVESSLGLGRPFRFQVDVAEVADRECRHFVASDEGDHRSEELLRIRGAGLQPGLSIRDAEPQAVQPPDLREEGLLRNDP